MSKESAMSVAVQANPQTPEIKPSPVTGIVPKEAKKEANPAVENGGAVPQPMVSTQLSHLAKKEAKLLADREAFKKEQEEFKDLKTKTEAIFKKNEEFETTRKTDPVKAMKELGFSEKEIVDFLSQEEPKLSTEEVVQAELKKFKEEETKKLVEAQKANDQVLVTKFKTQLNSTIKLDPDKYEFCNFYGPVAEDIMFEIAVQEAKQGIVPNPKSIANDVEEFYMQEFNQVKKLKKLTPKEEVILEAPKVERTRTVHPPQDALKPKPTTLTNKITATSAAIAKPVGRAETREEKRARIEQMLRNGLIK